MEKMTFWGLIASPNIKKIDIPTIQRDYAFGRRIEAFNRHRFLSALAKALGENTATTLDFVYGVENETMFVPLDGQQRLTTLWLLHWFVTYKAGVLQEARVKDVLLKFSYETRASSANFCRSLCALPPMPPKMSLREWITQQTWFYHQYKQDPTIMGMLNVISGTTVVDKKGDDIVDGFEEIFIDAECDYPKYWDRLTTTDCIHFNKLKVSLDDSDEIYVKMNARGRQLTDFENFKAELVNHINTHHLLDETEVLDFAAKLDVQWTDIFWPNKWQDDGTGDVSIDEIYFDFINRFVYLEGVNKLGEDAPELKKIKNTFTSFEPYAAILDKKMVNHFIRMMDRLRGHKLNTTSAWGELFDFIPTYVKETSEKEVSKTNQTHTLIFYGCCRYLINGEYDEVSFAEWNRVLWNICENRVDTANLLPTMKEIDILAPHAHNIIAFLSQPETIDCEYNKEQLREEQCKARHLNDYPAIREMEGYQFFKGAIRFLFTGENGQEDWLLFGKKVDNVKMLIPENKGERHTMKLFAPYMKEEALADIYCHCWVSNNNEDLRYLLLYKEAIPYLHHFLLQDDCIYDSELHKDVMALCENAFNGRGYICLYWPKGGRYVWTWYVRAAGYYREGSYVIGNKDFRKVSMILYESKYFELQQPLVHGYIRGLHLQFKYKNNYFTLLYEGEKYIICLMEDNWKKKMQNPNDEKGYCFSVQGIETVDQLVEQLDLLL